MKERPILFSAPMVRALLAGTKTQTRRVVKPQPPERTERVEPCGTGRAWAFTYGDPLRSPAGCIDTVNCPYGDRGDRLWVREAFVLSADELRHDGRPNVIYRAHPFNSSSDRAGIDSLGSCREIPTPWRPSIHMPRWASRLTLELVSVRAERLQDLSEEDAIAEGIEPATHLGPCRVMVPARKGFRHLWEKINGARAPWDSNPWVWALTFKRVGE
jgi:hypothetical protein